MSMVNRRTKFTLGSAAAAALGFIPAFTVLEMLIVVAMMTLITVGIAQVFKSAGDTVRAGKRISNLNAYATMVERQMRQDFASVTRGGFMVIRNQTAGGSPPNYSNDLIKLTVNDNNPRVRRADEIQFFAAGDFESKRAPVHPDRQARSTEAAIYYGFGLKHDPKDNNFPTSAKVQDDNASTMTPGFNMPSLLGGAGPDQYAADWMLLRYVRLLTSPNVSSFDKLPIGLVDPSPVYPGRPADPTAGVFEDVDQNVQISCQPALTSIFRPIAISNLIPLPPDAKLVRDDSPVRRPRPESGLVDVISEPLSTVRAIFLDAVDLDLPGSIPFTIGGDDVGISFPANDNVVIARMKKLMRQSLPADSDMGHRVRCQIDPPDWTGTIGSINGVPHDREYKRTDNEMLTAFNFVPHCTEFIVEWSFGKVYPASYANPQLRGQTMWHGMRRNGDINGNGSIDVANEPVARPYGDTTLNPAGLDLYSMPYRKANGAVGYWPANPNLLGRLPITGGSGVPQYWYFGIVDPTWRVPSAAISPGVYPGNGDMWYDPGVIGEQRAAGEPDTVPWPWPRLIRITMSLVDPSEPQNEQTFQFTFELPSGVDVRPF